MISISLWALSGFVVRAQNQTPGDPAAVLSNQAIVDFPREVTFQLEWGAEVPIVEAVLTYDVEQDSCLEASAQLPVEVNGDLVQWRWVMSRSGNPPPGSLLWWEWQLTDAEGNIFNTERQYRTLSDDRFDWQTVSAEEINLHWYKGDSVGQTLLEAAVTGLDRLEQEMGIQLQDEVQLFIYGSSSDMQDAVLYIQDWAGGIAFSEYNTILIGVPPSIADDWGRSTVQHELAHLVIGQFGRSCVGGSLPTWLSEGLAVFAEGDLQADFSDALNRSLAQDSFEPIRSLNGAFPTDDQAASAAYAQSYSIVAFMLDQFGQEQMQQLILTLANGAGYDRALEEVYGVNIDGLETAWRQSIGAPPRSIPPTSTPILAENVATVVPPGLPKNVPTPPSAAEPPPTRSAPSFEICGLGFAPLIVLIAAGKGHRKQRRAAGGGR